MSPPTSSTSGSSNGTVPPRRPSKRSKLRNGTYIIPSTGERSRGTFSLRTRSYNTLDSSPTSSRDDYFPSVWDSELHPGERLEALGTSIKAGGVQFWKWLNSTTGHGVLKCTLAYLLGSLFTFWAPLAHTLGTREGKHMVATITVYFHPARTVGSMLEAVGISMIAVIYAEIISILSMMVSVLIGGKLGMLWLSYGIVLVIFIGGGLGFVGWVKQRLNQPLVNVSCTLASIAIISVVTKENAVQHAMFSNEKIIQVLKMLMFGISISVCVNFLLWRVSARHILRDNMATASTTLGDMLSMITHGFLTGSEDELMSEPFNKSLEDWGKVYANMNKTMREAKFEHYALGDEKVYKLDKAVFKSLEALAQAIGGLKSSAYTQFTLMKETNSEPQPAGTLSPGSTVFSPTLSRTLSYNLKRGSGNNTLSVIDESPLEADEDITPFEIPGPHGEPTLLRTFRTPSDIFELFIALLGPSMKSFAYTLSEILREPPFGGTPAYNTLNINDHFHQSLQDSITLYNNSRATALHELYKSIELNKSRSEKMQADFEEVAAACGHFSFSLQALCDEMHHYLEALDELKAEVDANRGRRRTWNWMRFWTYMGSFGDAFSRYRKKSLPTTQSLLEQGPEGRHGEEAIDDDEDGDGETRPLLKRLKKSAVPKGIPDAMVQRRDSFAWDAAPKANKIQRTLSQRILKSLRILARDDIRFGLKVGIGAALWGLLAFLPQTQPMYITWRGEWGLVSFMIVCSMTVGASNTTGYARFLGTTMGASCAIMNWTLSDGRPLVLAGLGWVVSVAAFYVILVLGNAPMGRITLLAYNVSTLYAYSMSLKIIPGSDNDEDDGVSPLILEIVKHRVIAVMAGIVWGLVICRVVWPISARNKFKEGLSVFYLQLGLIWKRGPLAVLLRPNRPSTYLKGGEQAALARYSSRLESLRKSATAEFSLRGPFPDEAMARIMGATNRVLDAFHAMSLVERRRLENRPGGHHLSPGERVLLRLTAGERKVLSDRICHVFQVLASSFMLEYPLTEAIPSIQGSRDRLLGRIYGVRQEVGMMVLPAGGGGGGGTGGGGGGGPGEGLGITGGSINGGIAARRGMSNANGNGTPTGSLPTAPAVATAMGVANGNGIGISISSLRHGSGHINESLNGSGGYGTMLSSSPMSLSSSFPAATLNGNGASSTTGIPGGALAPASLPTSTNGLGTVHEGDEDEEPQATPLLEEPSFGFVPTATTTTTANTNSITTSTPATAAPLPVGGFGAPSPLFPQSPGATTVEERDYALLYAYALVTSQVAEELKVVEREVEKLYGVLTERDMLLQ